MARRGFTVLFTVLGIAVFISIAGFALLYMLFGREPAVPSRSTLVLNVGGDLSEMEPADVVGYLRGGKRLTVRGVIDNLRKAKVDTRVRAVLLKPTGFTSPFWSKVQEIRQAVIDFRKSGKPIYAYLEYGGDREYYLATAADKVFLMPSSPLDLVGVATYELFLRGTLDKVGAVPDLHHIGNYKTAVNTFTQKGFTPAHREMDESLNRDLYEQIVRGIADARKKKEEDIRDLIDDGPFMPEDALRAIVLRIGSPGGSASASDAIWRELMLARQEKADRPLVASMSDLAASGGYYIAMPAQVIVAQPSTLTGSIGIFGGKIATGGTYEKLGARIESTSIGKHAEINSPVRPYSPEELKKLQEQLQSFYDQFVEKVADSRHTTPEKIDALAQGRVWTGRQAKQNRLVDELGGLDDAIAIAKQRAKIPAESEVELVIYPPRKSFYEIVSDELSGSRDSRAVAAWLTANLSTGELEILRAVRSPLGLFRRGEPLALMPVTFIR